MTNNLALILIVCILVGAWGCVRAIKARSAERIAEIKARGEAECAKLFARQIELLTRVAERER